MGKFIVLYGIDGVGKGVQRKLLAERLCSQKLDSVGTVYRHENHYPPRGYPYNDFLRNALKGGKHFISENYLHTNAAYLYAEGNAGVADSFLQEAEESWVKPDIIILLTRNIYDGDCDKRVSADDTVTQEALHEFYLETAVGCEWDIVNADQPEQKVAEDIWDIVRPRILT